MAILSASEMLDWLGQNQFLSPEQTSELRPQLANFPESHTFAKELIRRDWLTPFQVNQILTGKHEQLLLDSYRLRERIGEGAMGQVFKAWHPILNRVVAIKMVHKEMVDNQKIMNRFRREVEAAARLDHPNITKVRDAGEIDGRPYLVMDFIDGFNLSTHVKQQGPLPIHEAVAYVRQAALGLQHAYEHNIVHRDIKPGNLLVTNVKANGDVKPVVKILDFGLARFDSEEESAERLTEMGKLLGTIDYVAPEQANNARGADIRADIYSLGCTMFFLLTGRPAFLGDTIMEKLTPRLTAEAPWVRSVRPEISPGLEEVLRKMMARQPEDRYQTPIEVANALERFLAPMTLTISPDPKPPLAVAMPVAPDAVSANVPLAQPIGASTPLMAPTPSTEEEPAFLGMTATGRDMSTPAKARAEPAPETHTRTLPIKLFVALFAVVSVFALFTCACIVGMVYFKDGGAKKTGTLRVVKTKWSTFDEKLIPGRHHFVLVWIERLDFKGPVKVWVKDLPKGVTSDILTIPPNSDNGQVKVTISFGTLPVTKAVRVYAESEDAGVSAEFPMTLVVKEDPLR